MMRSVLANICVRYVTFLTLSNALKSVWNLASQLVQANDCFLALAHLPAYIPLDGDTDGALGSIPLGEPWKSACWKVNTIPCQLR